MPRVFALVDCNNFYVSCERVFNPALKNRPVVVLSNNDGCIIARSNEAKQLGITMGQPCFQARSLLERHQVAVFSSNYTLYGDMSRRVMAILAGFTPELEIYSIDEAFLSFTGLSPERRRQQAEGLIAAVRRGLGIPVSVGVAETKTLAKIASRLAKKSVKAGGVVDLTASMHRPQALAMTGVADVWGVGRRTAVKLRSWGIETALQLHDCDDQWLRQKLGVIGQRLVLELRGIACLGVEQCPLSPKSVRCSRSFREPVETLAAMQEAVAAYLARAVEKIRSRELAASVLMVFLQTSRFVPENRYDDSRVVELPVASSSTRELLGYAMTGIEAIFRPGCRYKKAGVILAGLVPAGQVQPSMVDRYDRQREGLLMQAVDGINARLGSGTVTFAAEGLDSPWRLTADHRSPAYTSRWSDIPTVR
ncbi:MAG: Y-family DNA polymerase [Deltaproteobacteria bacterium]|nr:Y-family DNA polymerase [Candidatus Anaeroferrophillus wilburensis]MBN2889822.1 Y-family DNA polymerase [Deltaproteobacteria bacterium]